MSTRTNTEFSFSLNSDRLWNLLRAYATPRAWKNVAFLLLSFPLGIFYFIALVTGVSLGAGLAVTLIGIPILLFVFYAAGWVTQFEAWLVNRMIDADVTPTVYTYDAETLPGRIWEALKDGRRWKGIAYLFLRFPIGIASFVMTTVLISLPVALITAPLTFATEAAPELGFWTINTFSEALIAAPIGLVLGALALHIIAMIVGLWRGFTEWILSNPADARKAKNDDKRKNDDLIAA